MDQYTSVTPFYLGLADACLHWNILRITGEENCNGIKLNLLALMWGENDETSARKNVCASPPLGGAMFESPPSRFRRLVVVVARQ